MTVTYPPTELTLALLGTLDAWREHHPDISVGDVLHSLADVRETVEAQVTIRNNLIRDTQ